MFTPYKHQEDASEKLVVMLKNLGYAYLSAKPRSGKTLTAILTAEKCKNPLNKRVLVVCPKGGQEAKVIAGWKKFIEHNPMLKYKYDILNYEAIGSVVSISTNKTVKKQIKLKINPADYFLVIIDESHNYGVVGKINNRVHVIRKVCYNLPHLHLSGTAIVETANGIYHQMAISRYSPFKHTNFYDFFREYGVPYSIEIVGRSIMQYDRYQDRLIDKINEFTVYMEPDNQIQVTDQIHYVELSKDTKIFYNQLVDNKILLANALSLTSNEVKEIKIVADTVIKERLSLHMLESGIIKTEDDYYKIATPDKINYILTTFGDHEYLGIMSQFIGERKLLTKIFKKAKILSSTSDAEGVDLSFLKDFVILSSGYSGTKFIQRRDRIINLNGSNTTTVHHILVKKAISEQVYKVVSKKLDFNNEMYERGRI
ncbi:MAG: DEAD/DEAH box helicase family protein [Sulfurimonas sp.]|uniref:DEAD/DEAH box helicase family protein n=1 Tax=Sulfurimonas sp. TaxID=2022749 RepID=UPI003D14E0C2